MWKTANRREFRVKQHNPRRALLIRCAALVFLLGICWMIFEYGRSRGGYDHIQAKRNMEALVEQLRTLDSRVNELMSENAHLASSSEIDVTASKQVSEKLSELNNEMLELKEELVFYRSLLSPAELQPGVQVLGIQMIRDGSTNAYNYKIVLTQRHNGNQFASGDVSMRLNGQQAGEEMQLDLVEITASKDNEMSFRFKNFQSLEGRLVLPENFEPSEVLVSVNPVTRGIKQIERSYDWNTIVSGG